MTKLLKIVKSSNPKKKFDAIFKLDSGKEKKVSFGAASMRDFTLISNKNSKFYIPNKEEREKVRDNYQRRHKKDLLTEKNKKGLGAGALSFYLLWTTPKINISSYKKRFNL
tara:strand:- start:85 stop:417 length:333 start_codon:yes stop_codon:yes gene_type:complete